MRLWSFHPKYLDAKGLLAVWREGLLAQNVLLGLTKGYKNHPQLIRFRATSDPVLTIGCYLSEVEREAQRREYKFNRAKIIRDGKCSLMPVKEGQVKYEWEHLMRKLELRSQAVFEANKCVVLPDLHPLFWMTAGGVEGWERI